MYMYVYSISHLYMLINIVITIENQNVILCYVIYKVMTLKSLMYNYK